MVKPHFRFHTTYIGSTERGLITQDKNNRAGYDFDINIHVNAKAKEYCPEEIKRILMEAFRSVSIRFGYSQCVDKKRVFTIEKLIYINSVETVSCDFAVVNDWNKDQQWIILRDNHNVYSWQKQPHSEYELEKKADWIKQHGYWMDVRAKYIEKKNNNRNPYNKSRSLYATTINEVYMRYH